MASFGEILEKIHDHAAQSTGLAALVGDRIFWDEASPDDEEATPYPYIVCHVKFLKPRRYMKSGGRDAIRIERVSLTWMAHSNDSDNTEVCNVADKFVERWDLLESDFAALDTDHYYCILVDRDEMEVMRQEMKWWSFGGGYVLEFQPKS